MMMGWIQFGILQGACSVLFEPMVMAGRCLRRNKILSFSWVLVIFLTVIAPCLVSSAPFLELHDDLEDSCINFVKDVKPYANSTNDYNYDNVMMKVGSTDSYGGSWNWPETRKVKASEFQRLTTKSDASDLLNRSRAALSLVYEQMHSVRRYLLPTHTDVQKESYIDVLIMRPAVWHMLHSTKCIRLWFCFTVFEEFRRLRITICNEWIIQTELWCPEFVFAWYANVDERGC